MNEAITDLADMHLIDASGRFLQIRLTANGKNFVRNGLRSIWPGLVEGLSISDDARATLRALCSVCERRDRNFCELLVADSDELMRAASVEFAQLYEQWRELEQRRAVTGTTYMAQRIAHMRPTYIYIGFVLATQDANIKLQRLVEELVADWEGATVDHKAALNLGSPTEKAEAAKDILSLANTQARGNRYLVVGFDDKTRKFAQSFDTSITQDRLEDVLSTRASAIPALRVYRVAWHGGVVGLIEVTRNPAALPYVISQDLTPKIKKGDVFVRHGSHVAKASGEETADLEAEAQRATTQDGS